MKKQTLLFVLVSLFGLSAMQAQVTFRPGIKGGLNSSRFTQTEDPNEKFSAKTDYYVGIFGALKTSKIYTLNPELMYTRQGAKYEYIDQDGIRRNEEIDASYVSLAIANKFTFHKFNVHLGSTIDVKVNDTKKILGDTSYNDNENNGIDFAFFAGVGYDFTKNFGIEARVKKGTIPVDGNWDYTNILFQVGATYTFDVK